MISIERAKLIAGLLRARHPWLGGGSEDAAPFYVTLGGAALGGDGPDREQITRFIIEIEGTAREFFFAITPSVTLKDLDQWAQAIWKTILADLIVPPEKIDL